MKRSISLLLIAALVFSFMLASCGRSTEKSAQSSSTAVQQQSTTATQASTQENIDPLGKYDPPIEVSAVNVLISADVKFNEGEDAGHNVWIKAYEDELGIKANVWWGADNPDKVNLMIASGELPDIFGVDPINFQKLAAAGKLEDLTDVYEKYASPLTKELVMMDGGRALETCKVNGRLYAIPYYNDPINNLYALFVREDWRQKLNLPEPKTLDDVLTIAKAFAAEDLDGNGKKDTIGIYLNNNVEYTLTGIFAAFHAYPLIWVKDASGNLVHGMTQAEVIKPALQWLQNAYKAGLISREYPLKNSDLWEEDTVKESYGVIYGRYWLPEWPLQALRTKNPKAEWKSYPFVSADDKPAYMPAETIRMHRYFVERKGVSHPEAMIKMINLQTEKIFGKTADPDKYDLDPVTTSNIWKYTLAYVHHPRKDYEAYVKVSEAVTKKDPSGLNKEQQIKYDKIMKFLSGDQQYWWVNAEYGPGGSMGATKYHLDNNLIMFNAYFGVKTENMQNYEANLRKMFDETIANIILNNAPVDAYDKFVQDWKKQGGDAITKDVNDWYAARKK